jgi:hypothetical protein
VFGTDIDLPCPFLEITGVPCPLCGGTRAFVHAAQLQSSFLDYNAIWVFVALIVAIAGVAALVLKQVSRQRFEMVRGTLVQTSNRTRLGIVLVVVAAAWAWAIAHSSAIAD